jgi:tetratricopeptide (TPR) repeat protein
VQLALAAAVGLMALGGGAVGWWADRQAVKRAGTADGVRNLLGVAADLRRQYRFGEADDALAAALHLADVNHLDALRPEVEQARADLALVRQLDETRYRKWVWVSGSGRFTGAAALPAYRAALLAHGLDLAADDSADLAARVASSPVKPALVAALADWAQYEPDLPLKEKLLDVARRAEPGPWTDRLYDITLWADPARVKALAADLRAAAEAGSATIAPHGFVILADVMQFFRLDPVELLAAEQRRSPADFELNFALGQRLEESHPARAAGFYQAARAVRPDNAVVLVNLGVILRETGDADGAAGCFREAVRHDPRLAAAHFNLGVYLKAKGDADGAARCFEAAVAADPADPEAHNNLGILLKAKGDLDRAIGHFETAVRHDPKHAAALNNLGNALRDKGDLSGAILCYERAAAADPGIAALHHNLGHALLLHGDPDRAVAALREAVRLDRRDARFRAGLQQALEAQARAARVAPPPRPARPD